MIIGKRQSYIIKTRDQEIRFFPLLLVLEQQDCAWIERGIIDMKSSRWLSFHTECTSFSSCYKGQFSTWVLGTAYFLDLQGQWIVQCSWPLGHCICMGLVPYLLRTCSQHLAVFWIQRWRDWCNKVIKNFLVMEINYRYVCVMSPSGMLCRGAFVRTDVSEEPFAFNNRERRIDELRTTLLVTGNRSALRRNTLMMERILSSETSVFTRGTRRHITERNILRPYLR
jgi:hypothetical protein